MLSVENKKHPTCFHKTLDVENSLTAFSSHTREAFKLKTVWNDQGKRERLSELTVDMLSWNDDVCFFLPICQELKHLYNVCIYLFFTLALTKQRKQHLNTHPTLTLAQLTWKANVY